MEKHFITFYSPGSFVSEQSTLPIPSWDVEKAQKMAHKVKERYGATPYGFRFSTRGRTSKDLDSKETKSSGMFYLGGRLETLADVERRNDPDERILLSNMRCNGWDTIVINNNSWRVTQPFDEKKDKLLDWKPKPNPANQ